MTFGKRKNTLPLCGRKNTNVQQRAKKDKEKVKLDLFFFLSFSKPSKEGMCALELYVYCSNHSYESLISMAFSVRAKKVKVTRQLFVPHKGRGKGKKEHNQWLSLLYIPQRPCSRLSNLSSHFLFSHPLSLSHNIHQSRGCTENIQKLCSCTEARFYACTLVQREDVLKKPNGNYLTTGKHFHPKHRKTTLHITLLSYGTNSSGVIPRSLAGVREVSRCWGVDGSWTVLGKGGGGVEASVSCRDAADGATTFWSTERGTDPYLLITHLSLPPAPLNHNYSSPYPTPTVTSTSSEESRREQEGGREVGKKREVERGVLLYLSVNKAESQEGRRKTR